MSSWVVLFKSGNSEAIINLIDTIGPINEWFSEDKNSIFPDKGTFTNQTGKVVPTSQPSWILNNFDIDSVSIGDHGTGNMLDNIGTFPVGDFSWTVREQL